MIRHSTWLPTVVLVDASSLITQKLDPGPPYLGAREASASFVRSILRYAPIRQAIILSHPAFVQRHQRLGKRQQRVLPLPHGPFRHASVDATAA
jgi:hypothetical protein